MARRDVRDNEHSRLEALQKEGPQWLKQAHVVMAGWRPGENYLVTVMAQGLREAYEAGLRGEVYPPEVKTVRRTRPVKPEPETKTRVRRSRQ